MVILCKETGKVRELIGEDVDEILSCLRNGEFEVFVKYLKLFSECV